MRTLHLSRPAVVERAIPTSSRARLWLWLAGGALVFFLVPLIGADLAGLQPDLYYLIYFTVAVAWFAAFVALHASELRGLWTHNLGLSLAVGAVAGVAVGATVLNQDGTDHPDGWRFAFEILWRGVVYGTVDALTLFVFPAAVAYLLMRGNRAGAKRRLGFAGLALSLSLVVTTTYHLGYAEYRDSDLRSPEIGAIVANLPTMLTGNPVGAVVTHTTAHVTAVVHQREGGPTHMLPPQENADYPSRGDSDVAAGLATAWLIAAAAALTLLVRRRRTTRATPTAEERR